MSSYLISYDIRDGKILQQVAKRLQADGLERILKSVFLGSLSSLTLRELEEWLEKKLSADDYYIGDIIIIRLTPSEVDAIKLIGELKLDREELKGTKHTLFY